MFSPRSDAAPFPVGPPASLVAVFALLLAFLTLAVFRDVTAHPFVAYDDTVYVTENPVVQQGLSASSILWAFTAFHHANWHPLTWLSHMLDIEMFGLDAGKHHLVSLLLHASSTVVLFLLLVRMTGALWRSALAAALFGIHPLHVESVAWIAERKDVLSTLLWLLTIAAWLAFLHRGRKTHWYLLASTLFALGLMAKPMLVTLPFTLLLLDVWPLARLRPGLPRLRSLLVEKVPFFALSAASCFVTFAAQLSFGAVGTLQVYTVGERLANAVVTSIAYLGKTLWPVSLAVFYPHPHGGLPPPAVAGAALLLLALTGLALALGRGAPYLPFGWFWYVGTLVPVVGLVQVGGQAMADRYAYVPLIGIFVAFSWGAAAIAGRSRAARWTAAALCAVVLLSLGAVARAQLRYWSSSEALFKRALSVTRDNWMAHNNLGLILLDRGEAGEAIAHYREALRIFPGYKHAYANLGFALASEGNLEAAVRNYEAALEIEPGDSRVHFQLALALARLGRAEPAAAHYREALRLEPAFPEAHGNLANLLADAAQTEEALAHYREALRLRPDNPIAHYNLAGTLIDLGRLDEAGDHLTTSVRLRPQFPEAWNKLGLVHLREGRTAEAVSAFREALRVRPDYELATSNLARALARQSEGSAGPP